MALSIHFFDLLHLETNCPDLFNHFSDGCFTFPKTMSEFSCIALDQVHKQNNTIIKGGGATHLVTRSSYKMGIVCWLAASGKMSYIWRASLLNCAVLIPYTAMFCYRMFMKNASNDAIFFIC